MQPHTIIDALIILERDRHILLAERSGTGYADGLLNLGTPINAEPHKCAGIAWHPADHLPGNTEPYNALGIAHYLKGEPFSVHGW
jgi:hypothetical protein